MTRALRRRARAAVRRSTLLAALLAAGAAASAPLGAQGGVLPGVEVLVRDSLHLLAGKRVGLITNHSGRDRAGTSTIDVLFRAPGVKLVALFGPEHGIRGAARAGEKVASAVDSATGLPVHSLYGETRVPTDAMLQDVDVLVYDIQDVGARIYTFQWTMALAAAAARRPFIVLDRPDPIRADRVEGNVLRPAFSSFVGLHPVAMRYGLTPGELLRFLVGEGLLKADVTVIPMAGYRRSMWYDETGLPWVNPSPNIRDVEAALLYPGTVLFEGTDLSEGRGTDEPFKVAGAEWLTDAGAIAAALNARGLPGVRFDSTSKHVEGPFEWEGRTIPVVRVRVTDRDAVRPFEVGVWMVREILARHPAQFHWKTGSMDRLSGTDELRQAIGTSDAAVAALLARADAEARAFEERARKYRIYR